MKRSLSRVAMLGLLATTGACVTADDGEPTQALAGYHGGVGAVKRYGNQVPPFPNTRKYIDTVLARYYQYKADEAAGKPLLTDR